MKSGKLPLSFIQQDIYFDQMRYADYPLYNIGGYIHLPSIDIKRLTQAHKELVSKYDIFGTRIIEEYGNVFQIVSDKRTTSLPIIDLSHQADPQSSAETWLSQYFQSRISIENNELFKASLLKLSDDTWYYVGLAHHIMMDGWGFANWAAKLKDLYMSHKPGEPDKRWQDILTKELEYKTSEKYQIDKSYWMLQLENLLPPLFKPHYQRNFANQIAKPSQRLKVDIDKQHHLAMGQKAKQLNTHVSQLYQILLAMYFGVTYGQKTIAMGTPVHNRRDKAEKDMLGVFLSMVPMKIELDDCQSLQELCDQVKKTSRINFKHQRFSLGEMLRTLAFPATRDDLFQINYSYLHIENRLLFDEQLAHLVYLGHGHEQTPLMFTLWEYNESHIQLQIDYNLAYFSEQDVNFMVPELFSMMQRLLAVQTDSCVRQRVKQGSLFNSERNNILEYWKQYLRELPTLHSLQTDRPRLAKQDFQSRALVGYLSEEVTKGIGQLSEKLGYSVWLVLNTIFSVLIARYSASKDIVIAAPLEKLAGLTLDTQDNECQLQILRSILTEDPSFEALAKVIHTTIRNTLTYPLENNAILIDLLDLPKSTSHNELWQIATSLDNDSAQVMDQLNPDLSINFKIENNQLVCSWVYDGHLFEQASVERMQASLELLIIGVIADSSAPVSSFPLWRQKVQIEKHTHWNKTDIDWVNKDSCLHELFEKQAVKTPEKVALICREKVLTYTQLNDMSNQLAHYLVQQGVKKNMPVGICLARSNDMVVALLAVLKAGGAYLPLEPGLPDERLAYMVSDSAMELVITELDYCGIDAFKSVRCIDLTDLTTKSRLREQSVAKTQITSDKADLAYVIYTSGSTGKPKGVMVEHCSVNNFLHSMAMHLSFSQSEKLLAVTNLTFDISVLEIMLPLMMGGQVVLASQQQVTDPFALMQLLIDEQISVMQATPSTWHMLIEAGWQQKGSLKVLTGGEALPRVLGKELQKRSDRVWNVYGPTETTIWSSIYRLSVDDELASIIGSPLHNTQLYVLDENKNMVPAGVVGELYIGGEGLARGYWRRAELTEQRFVEINLSGNSPLRVYRTGDLVTRLPDGKLRYLGRIDNQIKLRGHRIEPGEIEHSLNDLNEIKQSVVICHTPALEEARLIAYCVASQSVAQSSTLTEHIIEQLATKLPSYMVPEQIIWLDNIPLTPNGKTDIRALPKPSLQDHNNHYIAPSTDAELTLVHIWQEVLGLAQVGVQDNFFKLGGHSLSATRMINLVRERMKVELTVSDFFAAPILKTFAQKIANISALTDIQPVTVARELQPSYAQTRLWFYGLLEDKQNAARYNMPGSITLKGNLDQAAFAQAVYKLIDRHQILRTNYTDQQGRLQLNVQQKFEIPLRNYDLIDLDVRSQQIELEQIKSSDAIKPFDLSSDVLIRFTRVALDAEKHVVLINVHHIAADAWSLGILTRELCTFYNSIVQHTTSSLEPLTIQYNDYAAWQRNNLKGDALSKQLSYWQTQLENIPQVHSLHLDKKRLVSEGFNLCNTSIALGNELSEQVRELCKEHDLTLYMLLQSVFSLFLTRLSGHQTILVGTPVSGRNHVRLENLIGFFVNLLVIRSDFNDSMSFIEHMANTRQTVLDALTNGDVPFEMLVEALNPERILTHHPLVQIVLSVQDNEFNDLSLNGLEVTEIEVDRSAVKFDLEVIGSNSTANITLNWKFNTNLFEEDTIANFAECFVELMNAVVSQPHRNVYQLNLISQKQRRHLLVDLNQTEMAFDQNICLHQLVERQAKSSPDNVAISMGEQVLSYAELDRRASHLAKHLVKEGIAEGNFVAICLNRSFNMVIAMLAANKVGAAFVPIDVNYPAQRIEHILNDCNAALLISEGSVMNELILPSATSLNIDTLDYCASDKTVSEIDLAKVCTNNSNNIAYVIYTSGSTGLPKGVIIRHKGMISKLKTTTDKFYYDQQSRTLQFSSFGFDAALLDVFLTLANGAQLILMDKEQTRNPEQITAVIRRYQVTNALLPPSILKHLDPAECKTIKTMVSGGEAIPRHVMERWAKHCRIINAYGPTESTVCVTSSEYKGGPVTIGNPMGNCQVVVVDNYNQPVLSGVVGELLISDVGIAVGYLNRNELTKQKFIANPFPELPAERLYRSGDLVRRLANGELEYIGRIDHQVKLRGYRVELGDIESKLVQIERVKDAMVLVKSGGATEQVLVAYCVISQLGLFTDQTQIQVLLEFIVSELQKALPDYMVPKRFILLDDMPTTANGKADINKLMAMEDIVFLQQRYTAPRSILETVLCQIWQDVLGVNQVGVDDNFFTLGGDSITSIQVAARAKQQGILVNVRQLFEHQTVAALANNVIQGQKVNAPQGAVEGKQALLPVHHFLQAQGLENPNHFNQAIMLQTPYGFDLAALKYMVSALLQRHDVFRLVFPSRADELVGEYLPVSDALLHDVIACHDLAEIMPEQRIAKQDTIAQSYQAGLSLETGPLAKVVFFDYGDEVGRLLFIMHHFVVDGVSWRILFDDLLTSWRAYIGDKPVELMPKSSSYQQWGAALRNYADNTDMEQEVAYWKQHMQIVPALPVTINPKVPAVQAQHFELSDEVTSSLLNIGRTGHKLKINELLLAALLCAFQKWSGNQQVRVLLEGHGREDLFAEFDLSSTIGWFTSHFPIVLGAEKGQSLHQKIASVKGTYRSIPSKGIGFGIAKYLQQNTQLKDLDESKNAIMFNYLGQVNVADNAEFSLVNEPIGDMVAKSNKALAPVTINSRIQRGKLQVEVSADAVQFEQSSIELFTLHLQQAITEIIHHCGNQAPQLTPEDFPFADISQSELEKLQSKNQDLQDLYFCTPLQAGLLFHGMLDGTGSSYTEQTYCDLVGDLDVTAFEQAWQSVVAHHDILRTCFVELSNGKMHQIVKQNVAINIVAEDWRLKSREQQQTELTKLLEIDREQGFNFESAPLMRFKLLQLADSKWHFIWSHHHVLLDGWCLPIIFKEVVACYTASRNKEVINLKPATPYFNYIEWLYSQDKQKAREFWLEQLAGFRSVTSPVIDKLPSQQESCGTGPRRQTLSLNVQLSQSLQELAKKNQSTLNVIAQAAYALLLREYSGEDDILFGTPISGRPAHLDGVEEMMGLFINTVPVRVRCDAKQSLEDLLRKLHSDMIGREENHHLGLAEIQTLSELPPGVPLFDCLLTFENYPTLDKVSDLDIDKGFEVLNGQSTGLANYGLTAIFQYEDEHLSIHLDYLAKRINDEAIARLLGHLEQILICMAGMNSSDRLEKIELLTAAETTQLLDTFNQSDREYPKDRCLQDIFEEHAAANPANLAVRYGNDTITYGELNERANQVAHYLIDKGVKPDTLVGISVERSIEMFIGLLGIIKAGGAYVPLDPEYPQARLRYMIEDSGVDIILTESHLYQELDIEKQTVVLLDEQMREVFMGQYSTDNPDREALGLTPQNLIYAIYTSGSTGQPKGVLVEHHTVINFLYYSAETFMPEWVDGALVSAPLAFDGTVCTLYTPFMLGKYVDLLPVEDTAFEALADYLFDDSRALLFKLTPAHLETLSVLCRGRQNEACKHVFVIAGEILTEKNLANWRDEYLPSSIFFNEYGPTECTVGTTVMRTYAGQPIETGSKSVPIGSPLANAKLYVLGERRQLKPIGTPGELYIGGLQLARGYHNRPDLTDERFLNDPYSSLDGARMYKTGDLVRWLANGNIEFLGRIDNQVKLRGFRLELGEIEYRLNELDGVRESVVVLREDLNQEKRIVAYVITSIPLEAEDEELLAEQKLLLVSRYIEELKGNLPQFMIPRIFIFVEQMPLTPNGKVDRANLPAPGEGDIQKQIYIAPRNTTESQLCDIWAEVLGVEHISINDDFFMLGGHSLLATQVIALIREKMRMEISVRDLFEKTTIEQFAPVLEYQNRLEQISRNRQRLQDSAEVTVEGEI